MASRKELRAAIAEARGKMHRAIVESAAAWERTVAGQEGEGAWSPRQSIEHAASAELFFASTISLSCGYPPLELKPLSFATAADAAQEFALVTQKADSILQYVSDDDMGKKADRGPVKGMTVQAIMELIGTHDSEHAAQALAAAQE
jgi:uncharacterized damage-inducible protein DinB